MKDIVRCIDCATCAVEQIPGFTGGEVLHCTERRGTVEADDGCTFGAPGELMRYVPPEQVLIDSRAAVNGYHLW